MTGSSAWQVASLLFADRPSSGYVLRRYLLAPVVRLASRVAYMAYSILRPLRTQIDRPIFIVGCSRSGTSILVDLFSQHPDIANWSEAAQVFELDYYNPEIDHFKDETQASEADRRRLTVFFLLYAWACRRRRFVNKHPQNSLRIRYLNAIFPRAIFIHVFRNPFAVVSSNMVKEARDRYRRLFPYGNFPKPRNWRELSSADPETRFAHQWLQITAEIRRAADECLTPDRYIEVDYASLCADPRGTLARLDAFCGLTPAARQVSHVPERLAGDDSKWRSTLSETQIETISRIVGTYAGEPDSQRRVLPP